MATEAGKEQVEYQFLGKSGLKVSNICLGTMTFGKSEGMFGFFKNPTQSEEALSHRILDRFTELGGNFIDTANIYSLGNSEKIIGNWLTRQKREKVVVATKCRFQMDQTDPNSGGLSRRHIIESIEQSLERLKTNFIDLYQMHMWDAATPIEETLRTFDDLVRSGKVRYIGCSNLVGWQLQKVMDYSKFMGLTSMISLQQQYNLMRRHSELEEFRVCRNEGVGVIPWSPLKGGLLTGKFKKGETPDPEKTRIGYMRKLNPTGSSWSKDAQDEGYWNLITKMEKIAKKNGKTVAQIALRWLLQKDIVVSVIVGATSVKQLEDNIGAGKGWSLSDEDMKELDDASSSELFYPYDMNYGPANTSRVNPYNQ